MSRTEANERVPTASLEDAIRTVLAAPQVLLYGLVGALAVMVALAVVGSILSVMIAVTYLAGVGLLGLHPPVLASVYPYAVVAFLLAWVILSVGTSIALVAMTSAVVWAPFKGAVLTTLARRVLDDSDTVRGPTDRDTFRALLRWGYYRGLAARIVAKGSVRRFRRARAHLMPVGLSHEVWRARAGFLATAIVVDGHDSLEAAAEASERRAELLGGDAPRIRTGGLVVGAIVYLVGYTLVATAWAQNPTPVLEGAMLAWLIGAPAALIAFVVVVEHALRIHQYELLEDVVAGVSPADGDEVSEGSEAGELRWRREHVSALDTSPTVVGGTVFVGGLSTVVALNRVTGQTRWRGEPGGDVGSAPFVSEGQVYVGTRFEAGLAALDAATGERRWRVEADDVVRSPVAIDGRVIASERRGTVFAVDAETGDERWRFDVDDEVTAPVAADGTVYVGCGEGAVQAIDLETGDSEWRAEIDGGVEVPPTVADGTVYVGATNGFGDEGRVVGNVTAIDAGRGTRAWRTETAAVTTTPTVWDGTVYVGRTDGILEALDGATGDRTWQFSAADTIVAAPTVAAGTIFVGAPTSDGAMGENRAEWRLYAIDGADGSRQWTFRTDGQLRGAPTVVDGIVYACTADDSSQGTCAFDAGVDGSSEDSRVLLGTHGHHEDWARGERVTTVADPFGMGR